MRLSRIAAFGLVAFLQIGMLIPQEAAAAPPPAVSARDAEQFRTEAKRLADKDRYREAIPLAEKLVAYYEASAQEPEKLTEALLLLADIALKNSEIDRAETLYQRIWKLADAQHWEIHHPLLAKRALGEARINLIRWDYRGAGTNAHMAAWRQLSFNAYLADYDSLDTAQARLVLGRALTGQGKLVEAREELTNVLNVRERHLGWSHPDVAEVLDALGDLEHAEGKDLQARKNFELALSIRDKALGKDSLASTTSMLGLAECVRIEESLPLVRRALAIREKILGREHYLVGMAHGILGMAEFARGQCDVAETEIVEALSVLKREFDGIFPGPRLAYAMQLVTIYGCKLDFHRVHEAHTSIQKIFDRALEFSLDPATHAKYLRIHAVILKRQGEYGEAETALRRAYTLMRSYRVERLDDLNIDLAEVLAMRGDYTAAEQLMTKTIRQIEEKNGASSVQLQLARLRFAFLLVAQNEPAAMRRAIPMLRDGLQSCNHLLPHDDYHVTHILCARAHEGLASAYLLQGNEKDAAKSITHSLEILSNLGPSGVERAQSLWTLSQIHLAQGDHALAEDVARRAFAIDQQLPGQNHPEMGRAFAALAEIALVRSHVNEAITLMSSSVDNWEHNAQRLLMGASEEQRRALFATVQQDTDAAISLHVHHAPNNVQAMNLALTAILRRKGRVMDAMSDAFSQFRRQFTPEVRRASQRLREVKHELELLERKLFNDMENYKDVRERSDKLEEEQRALERIVEEHVPSQRLRDVQREITMFYTLSQGQPLSPKTQERLRALEDERESLERDLSSRNADATYAYRPIEIATIQSAIPKEAALVEIVAYHPLHPGVIRPEKRWGKRCYAAYVVHHEGKAAFVDLGEADIIDRAIGDFRKALSHPTRDVEKPGRALDQLLMTPLLSLIGPSRHIFISPDGALNLVPFGALVDDQGHYRLESYDFTYLTTGRDLLRVNEMAGMLQETVIFGDPDFGPLNGPIATDKQRGLRSAALGLVKFPRLSETASEAREVAQALPRARVLLGGDATEATLKDLQRPRILHLATHGFFLEKDDAKNETPLSGEAAGQVERHRENRLLRSGLALAGANIRKSGDEDGILTALEVSGLNLDGTNLVTLSACEAGLGDVSDGDGVYGLRRALVLAGSETQVLSLWSVDDEVTRKLMVGYYQALAAGVGRSAAMREVSLSIAQECQTRHPYFWASFVVSGDWRALDGKEVSPDWGKVARPRGCACDMASSQESNAAAAVGLFLALAWVSRRRRALQRVSTSTPWNVARAMPHVQRRLVLGGLAGFLFGCGGAKPLPQPAAGSQPPVCDLERAWANLLWNIPPKEPVDVLKCRVECRAGVHSSCVAAGLYYDRGLLLPKDGQRAQEIFELQCLAEYVPACAALGRQLAVGDDEADAIRGAALLRNTCAQGELHACLWLAHLHAGMRNRGKIEKDPAISAELYEKACRGGIAAGCGNLGVMYANGNGVKSDPARAATLFMQACDQGDAEGCRNIGVLHQEGTGVTKDLAIAATYYRRACDGGYALGCGNLGVLYANGAGVSQDATMAATLYEQACEGNDMASCSNLGHALLYGTGVTQDVLRAVSLFRRMCNSGTSAGCVYLGFVYQNGYGVPQDSAEAAKRFKQACDDDDAEGCNNLAVMIQTGTGVPKDVAKAAALYQRACDQGLALACKNLEAM